MSEDYNFNVDTYQGPMDLLLYLIKKNEVDIFDIPIAKITDQFIEHLSGMKLLDPNVAGDFLVMASTLMEIKSRMMIPDATPDPEEEEEFEDPRTFLVQQLLEYKKFKEAAAALEARGLEHLHRAPHPPSSFRDIDEDEKGVMIGEVSLSDLQEAFRRILKETMLDVPKTFVYDEVSLKEHIERIQNMVMQSKRVTFKEIIKGRNVMEMVGSFIAMLELIRQRRVKVEQTNHFEEIWVYPAGITEGSNAPVELDVS